MTHPPITRDSSSDIIGFFSCATVPTSVCARIENRLIKLEADVLSVAIECDCRAEHGAAVTEHLLAIKKMLLKTLSPSD